MHSIPEVIKCINEESNSVEESNIFIKETDKQTSNYVCYFVS